MTALLELAHITKRYGALVANDDVSLKVMPGEIHALLGENGAGKSTLMKVLTGLVKPDEGQVFWRGKEQHIHNPQAAKALGIAMVHQHFALFEGMSVLENIALGLPGQTASPEFEQKVLETAATYKLSIHPRARVFTLSAGEKQRIEIVRAMMADPALLVLDEPTSVLTPQEATDLFHSLRAMTEEGRGIIFISHKLNEVRDLCSTATILRGGKMVGQCDPRVETPQSLAERMIGHRVQGVTRKAAGDGSQAAPVLSIKNFQAEGIRIDDLTLHAGEIVGVAGVAGNGQDDLFAVLSGEELSTGLHLYDSSGQSQDMGPLGPNQRRNLHAAFVPEERLGHAAVVSMSLIENVLLTGLHEARLQKRGLISWGTLRDEAAKISKEFDVRHPGLGAVAGALSGGNLQKFVMGRELLKSPRLLVVNQPTWGVDMGAAERIRQAMLELAATGAALLVISQDLDELFDISDSIAVLHDGTLSAARARDDWTPESIGLVMTGSHDDSAAAGHAAQEASA